MLFAQLRELKVAPNDSLFQIPMYLFEIECVCMNGGGQREGQVGYQLSVGLDPRTLRSGPEPKSDA